MQTASQWRWPGKEKSHPTFFNKLQQHYRGHQWPQTHQTRELCGNNVCIVYREIPVLKGLFAGKHEALALSWPSVVVLLSNLPVYQWSKVKATCSKLTLKKTKVSTGSGTASQDKEHTPMLQSLLFQARERFTICICGQLWSNSLTEPIKTRIQQQPKFSGKERQPGSWQVALPGAARGHEKHGEVMPSLAAHQLPHSHRTANTGWGGCITVRQHKFTQKSSPPLVQVQIKN